MTKATTLPDDRPFVVRLKPDLRADLDAYAEAYEISLASALRLLLVKGLQAEGRR